MSPVDAIRELVVYEKNMQTNDVVKWNSCPKFHSNRFEPSRLRSNTTRSHGNEECFCCFVVLISVFFRHYIVVDWPRDSEFLLFSQSNPAGYP